MQTHIATIQHSLTLRLKEQGTRSVCRVVDWIGRYGQPTKFVGLIPPHRTLFEVCGWVFVENAVECKHRKGLLRSIDRGPFGQQIEESVMVSVGVAQKECIDTLAPLGGGASNLLLLFGCTLLVVERQAEVD